MTGMEAPSGRPLRSLLLCLIVLAGVGMLYVLFQADAGWSASVDLSHHYALAYRLGETWQLVPDDPTLGEMNVYPRLAHIAAALVGLVTHSTLLGMQVVALASVAIVWGAFFLMLATLPRIAAGASMLLLALLVYLNHTFWGLPVHGAEIVESYFFSQLVAQALTLLVIALAMRLEQHASRWHAYALILAALYVVSSTHLLPAIELLGVLAGLLALDVLAPGSRRRPILTNALLLAAGVSIVVLHPAFAVMRSISDSNGALGLVGFSSISAIVALCVGSLLVSLCLLYAWWRDGARLPLRKYLAVYGAALAALCLLQIVLVHLHIGSDYAVKKYVFGLLSFVAVACAVLLGSLVANLFRMASPSSRSLAHTTLNFGASATFACIVLALAAGVTVFYAASWHKAFDLSDAVTLERQLVALRDNTLATPLPGRSNVVVDLPNQPAAIGYMFSLGIMHVPRALAIRDNYMGETMGPVTDYANVITVSGQGRYGNLAKCARAPGPLLVLEPACLHEAIAAASICKGTFDFTNGGNVAPSMLTGFSGAEAAFRWTDGNRSTITCQVAQPLRTAQLLIAPFMPPSHQRQRASISVNGGAPVQVAFNGNSEPKLVEVALPPVAPGTKLVMTIDMPDAVSPQALGLGGDGRKLGLAVHSLAFH
jgi:hypothetical protein